jgi:UDP-N-acetylmuramyl pentapeptide phosphotransferase/UDP-N-acetylglucosamine-1-phosphate transferase
LGEWGSRSRWRPEWLLRRTARAAAHYLLRRRLDWCGWRDFVDDLRELGPPFRLLAQIGGALFLYFGGWRLPFSSSAALAIVAQCLFVIVFVNAFNFLDGADGLAAGITAVIALGYAAMPGVRLSVLGYAVAWSLLGACVGFLFFDFPPAKIFMGVRRALCWDSARRFWVWT